MFDEQQIGRVLAQVVLAPPEAVITCNLPATVACVSDAEAIRAAMIAPEHGADIRLLLGELPPTIGGDGPRGVESGQFPGRAHFIKRTKASPPHFGGD